MSSRRRQFIDNPNDFYREPGFVEYNDGSVLGPTPPQRPAPKVIAEEPVMGDWIQDNNWGVIYDTTQQGWPLANDNRVVPIIQNPKFRGPTRGRGLILSRRDRIISSVVTPSVNLKARITIGVGGSTQTVLCDWGPNVVINLPSSNTDVDCIVNGNNDFLGEPMIGSYLQAMFSNEILPKEGFNTLTELYDFNSGGVFIIPSFVKGFMFENDNMPDTDELAFYSPGFTTSLARFTVGEMAGYPSGTVFNLPTAVTYWGRVFGASPVQAKISWVLSV